MRQKVLWMYCRGCKTVIIKLKGKNVEQKIGCGLAKCAEDPYICNVFHGIRFKVSKDWLSGDNQFFLFIAHKSPSGGSPEK